MQIGLTLCGLVSAEVLTPLVLDARNGLMYFLSNLANVVLHPNFQIDTKMLSHIHLTNFALHCEALLSDEKISMSRCPNFKSYINLFMYVCMYVCMYNDAYSC